MEFAKANGLVLDPWQRRVLDDFSGVHADGRFVSQSNYLLTPRQNGKSEVALARALYGLFKLRKRMILYSSHQWASSNEIFLRMKTIIEESPRLSEQVAHTRLSAAQLGFELVDGGRIMFLTRSRAAARGFSGDELHFDECHFLSEAAHAALRPALGGRSAEGDVQTFYYSSAVDQSRHPDGLVAARLRRRGMAGEDGLAFTEYSAALLDEEGHELLPALVPAGLATDPKLIRAANPGCPKRVSLEFLLDEARTLDAASFATEHLGLGDWPDLDGQASNIVDLGKWSACADPSSSPSPPFVIGFDIRPDRRRAAISIAGKRLDGQRHAELVDAHEGVGWLVPRLVQLIEEHDPHAVICDAAHGFVADQVSEQTGVQVERLDRGEMAQACSVFVDLVEQCELRHLDDPELLNAIRGAGTSSQGGDGWLFSRRNSRADISPLYSTIVALMAVERMPADIDEWVVC